MDDKISGSCHCGLIGFEIKNNPKIAVNCHCDDCKKRNGSAFSTYAGVDEIDLVFTEGENYLKKYMVKGANPFKRIKRVKRVNLTSMCATFQ